MRWDANHEVFLLLKVALTDFAEQSWISSSKDTAFDLVLNEKQHTNH
jgi:hypothetical protein